MQKLDIYRAWIRFREFGGVRPLCVKIMQEVWRCEEKNVFLR